MTYPNQIKLKQSYRKSLFISSHCTAIDIRVTGPDEHYYGHIGISLRMDKTRPLPDMAKVKKYIIRLKIKYTITTNRGLVS